MISEGKWVVRVGFSIPSASRSPAVFVIRMSWGGPMATRRCVCEGFYVDELLGIPGISVA